MSYEFIVVEKKDRLTTVTINRPDRRNALHPMAMQEMDRAFNEFADDPQSWAAIVIAAVNGFALGGGFEIALACDIIVASETATFGLPEPKVGLMAAAGGVHRLPRHVPYHVAMGMILTGRHISADEAYAIGLVNEVVPPGQLMTAAEKWASDILECAPLSVQASKEAVMRGLELPLDRAVDTTFPTAMLMYQSDDFVEGPKAFSEKRKPNWTGK